MYVIDFLKRLLLNQTQPSAEMMGQHRAEDYWRENNQDNDAGFYQEITNFSGHISEHTREFLLRAVKREKRRREPSPPAFLL